MVPAVATSFETEVKVGFAHVVCVMEAVQEVAVRDSVTLKALI